LKLPKRHPSKLPRPISPNNPQNRLRRSSPRCHRGREQRPASRCRA
jgi:hypothetical protein